MSAIIDDNSTLLVIETNSICSGYEIFQEILSMNTVKPLEGFPTLNGGFIILLTGNYLQLKKIKLTKFKKQIKSSVYIQKIHDQVLKGFYNLLKNEPSESTFVAESNYLGPCLEIAQCGVNNSLKIIEIRSSRSLNGLNFIMLSGSESNMSLFKLKFKKIKGIKTYGFVNTSSLFKSFFGFPG